MINSANLATDLENESIQGSATHQPTLADILPRLRQQLPALAERYSIRSLGVFGSYVRSTAAPDSDLDLLVEFTAPPTLFEFVRLQRQLSELAGVQVDLVMKKTLKPHIRGHILAEVIPV
jgi:predicted nucleotidyltransferase